jgi:hypothetical protein
VIFWVVICSASGSMTTTMSGLAAVDSSALDELGASSLEALDSPALDEIGAFSTSFTSGSVVDELEDDASDTEDVVAGSAGGSTDIMLDTSSVGLVDSSVVVDSVNDPELDVVVDSDSVAVTVFVVIESDGVDTTTLVVDDESDVDEDVVDSGTDTITSETLDFDGAIVATIFTTSGTTSGTVDDVIIFGVDELVVVTVVAGVVPEFPANNNTAINEIERTAKVDVQIPC